MESLTIASDYETYKTDTKIVLNWLAISANSRGYKSTLPTIAEGTSKRAKGKKLPAARPPISIRELVHMANFLAQLKKPKLVVPITIQKFLRRTIDM